MRILWITNIIFPECCKVIGIPSPVAGGWLESAAKQLVANSNVTLSVATVYSGKTIQKIKVNQIYYYLLPSKNIRNYDPSLERCWINICKDFKPDIAHIHGTEYPYGLSFLNSSPEIQSIISIQGLVSICTRYYYAGMSNMEILKNITFRDLIKHDSLFQQRSKFQKQGLMEIKMLKKTQYVIGRTSWDKAHTLAINPQLRYYFCNETLRASFYNKKWVYEQCEKSSIFISQASYPLKGLHVVLRAFSLVLEKFPKSKIFIAGINITACDSFMEKVKLTGYGRYLKSLIKKLGIGDKLIFTGLLNEEQICSYYLRCNVFVCPSSIENSPNSLGEAQLLGVPCIASYVGGIPDMMQGCEDSLYRFEEYEMLAEKIIRVFSDENICQENNARFRHSQIKNQKCLVDIYNDILHT